MQCNVSRAEQVIRISAGIAIVVAGIMFHSWWGLIGLVPLATGAMRWCPAYQVLGLRPGCKT